MTITPPAGRICHEALLWEALWETQADEPRMRLVWSLVHTALVAASCSATQGHREAIAAMVPTLDPNTAHRQIGALMDVLFE